MTLPVVEAAADYFGISVDRLLSSSRLKRVVVARIAAAWLLRHRDGLSYPRIADILKRKDHSTAIHWINCGEEIYARNEDFARFVDAYMMLPRYSRARLDVESPYPAPGDSAPRRAPTQPRKNTAARSPMQAFTVTEMISDGSKIYGLNEDGNTEHEVESLNAHVIADRKFVSRLREFHPERFAA